MFLYTRTVPADLQGLEPDADGAAALEQAFAHLYGRAQRYLLQSWNFRGRGFPYRDLVHAIAMEDLNLAELAAVGAHELGGRVAPERVADRADRDGDLVSVLTANAEFEARTGQELVTLYESSGHAPARGILAYFIVRAVAHRRAFVHALATLDRAPRGLPPETDLAGIPDAATLLQQGVDRQQYSWTTDGSYLGLVLREAAEGGIVASSSEPERHPYPTGAAQRENFAPGLPADVQDRVERVSDVKDYRGAPVF